MNRLTCLTILVMIVFAARVSGACARRQGFAEAARSLGADLARDLDGDGRPDLFLWLEEDGRARRLFYARPVKGEADVIDLNETETGQQGRHLVIFLDGFGYDVVRQFWDDGGLRFFPAPSRVIAPYPAMTDLCLQGALGLERCRAYEAAWYNREANGLDGGLFAYVAGTNQPYNRVLDYRRLPLLDGFSYLFPWCTFQSESGRCTKRFLESRKETYVGYLVGAAGVSTRQGAEGQRRCLARLESLVSQVLRATGGKATVTLLSDHGHTYTPARPAPLDRHLREKGWRLRDEIQNPRDVVSPRLGLVTYAGFWTRNPAALAADAVACEAVDLASYVEAGVVVVLDGRGGRARVRQRGGRFAYECLAGDPLALTPVLSGLSADGEGYYREEDLFAATVVHPWPDPLRRLWRAHCDLVDRPPDVVVSLKDPWFAGSGLLAKLVSIQSTHGGLNYANSAAFVMSTAGALPENLRNEDLPAVMRQLTGRPWP